MRAELSDLIAGTPSLLALEPMLRRAAASEAPVLIVGEPGTGRTALARALHGASGRADAPLVEADVATIPAALFESDLFGHRAGAFTGANQARVGRVERAAGGSLLLDQVEELPLEVQPKLLRLLAELRYTPLGGEERTANLRVLAVASEQLPARVERGIFRRDLYHRLEILAFALPPLRRRTGDLEPLVAWMLAGLCRRQRRDIARLAPSSLAWMRRYSWPGNLRELHNLLERAVVLQSTAVLEVEAPLETGPMPRALVEVERDAICRALEYTRGHQGKAAKLLGISRKALWQKRSRLGLP